MALPPIISNLPFLKVLGGRGQPEASAGQGGEKKAPQKAQGPKEDVVEISSEARKRAAEEADKARNTASQTRQILEQDESATLGLDPDFSA